jgi:hypothetical protein
MTPGWAADLRDMVRKRRASPAKNASASRNDASVAAYTGATRGSRAQVRQRQQVTAVHTAKVRP